MNQWLPTVGRSLGSLAILGIGIAGFFWLGKPEVPTQEPAVDPPPLVTTVPAIADTEGIDFEVDGVVVPYREIEIAALVAGRVEYKSESCRSGMTVRKGDVLLRIEDKDYELEVKRLDEEYKQADAMISELKSEIVSLEHQIELSEEQLEIDLKQLRRNIDLQARRAASESEVDSAKRSQLGTQNTLQSLKDQKDLLTNRQRRMESAKALVGVNLEKAKLNKERTEIIAPIDAVVVSESVEQGGYVQSGGTVIVLQDTSRLDVTCKLYMRQMHWLWQSDGSDDSADAYEFPDTAATVIYELGDEVYAWKGILDRYDGAGIDSQTRMVSCRVHVDDPTTVSKLTPMSKSLSQQAATASALVSRQSDTGSADAAMEAPVGVDSPPKREVPGDSQADSPPSRASEIVRTSKNRHPPTLMTGMFVKVRVHANPPIPLVRLPQQAIQPGNAVWIVQDGKLKKKSITIANSTRDYVVAYQLSGGLKAGDLVVTSPLASPSEDMKVSMDLDDATNRSQAGRGKGGPGKNGQRKGTRS